MKRRHILMTFSVAMLLLTGVACQPDATPETLSQSSSEATTSRTSESIDTQTSQVEVETTPSTQQDTEPSEEEPAMQKYAEHAQASQDALWDVFWNENLGYFNSRYPANPDDQGHNYWWFAHSIDVMVDAYERTGDSLYLERARTIMDGVIRNNGNSLINNFFDDMDWMALALLRVYDHTDDDVYLNHAKRLFRDIQTAWSSVGGGGLGWQKNRRHFKNTPTNAPGTILAVRLYERTGDTEYQEWAHRIFDWMHETLRDADTGYINDGINDHQDDQLTTNAYTYNHGTYIGAAVEMYRMTGEDKYLTWAEETFQNAKKVYAPPSGILNETGEGDGGLFKGILIRYITLYNYAIGGREDVADWVYTNADAVIARSVNPQGLISDNWSGPPKREQDLSSHLSGVKLLEAASKLETVDPADHPYQPFELQH